MDLHRAPAAFAAGIAAAMILCPAAARAQSMPHEIAPEAFQSTLSVLPVVPQKDANADEPEGTGFVVGDGRDVLTANHVLGKATEVHLRLSDGTVVAGEIVVRDKDTDIALLRSSVTLPALELGGEAAPGDAVCAAGNAFGLGIGLTCGVVSAFPVRGVGFNPIEDFIQTDAAVNPGMSGAPLFGSDGRVAGMVSAIFTKGQDGNLGVNFATSARLIEAFRAEASDGTVSWPEAGLALRPYPPPGRTGEPGGEVMHVRSDSREAAAGIEKGDVVRTIGGLAVHGQPDYLTAGVLAAAGTITYEIDRGGETRRIVVPTGEK